MPEDGRIESIQFRMARTAIALVLPGGGIDTDGNVDVFISRAAPSPPNFTDQLVGSTVQIPLSAPGAVNSTLITSDFGNQFLTAGQFWLRAAFGTPIFFPGASNNWFAPVALPTGLPGVLYYSTTGTSGWTSQVDYPKFSVLYNNGTISVGGGACSTPFSSPTIAATRPMNEQQIVQLRGANPAGAPAALLVGGNLYPTPLDLSVIGATGCNLYVDSWVSIPGTTNANGWLDTQLTYNQPFVYYTQYLVAAPGNPLGIVLTNYVRTFTGTGVFL